MTTKSPLEFFRQQMAKITFADLTDNMKKLAPDAEEQQRIQAMPFAVKTFLQVATSFEDYQTLLHKTRERPYASLTLITCLIVEGGNQDWLKLLLVDVDIPDDEKARAFTILGFNL